MLLQQRARKDCLPTESLMQPVPVSLTVQAKYPASLHSLDHAVKHDRQVNV